MNLIKRLTEQKLISPPAWLPANTMYLTIMGSIAYGVADTNEDEFQSDFDVYGFCIPPKEVISPSRRRNLGLWQVQGGDAEELLRPVSEAPRHRPQRPRASTLAAASRALGFLSLLPVLALG